MTAAREPLLPALALAIGILLFGVSPMGLQVEKAYAAGDPPVITHQPQNPSYPEGAVAIYNIWAEGDNLSYTWYLEYDGITYNFNQSIVDDIVQPWEGFATGFGISPGFDGAMIFIEGIESGLGGAKLYCVVEDGHYDVKSDVAIVSVGAIASPPSLTVPVSVTCYQGSSQYIICTPGSSGGQTFSFEWYETSTGKLEDIKSLEYGAHTNSSLKVDTSTTGTRYYVCAVGSSNGGFSYSSVIPVTVLESQGFKRLAGSDRFSTGSAIVEEGFSSKGGSVVIATGLNYPDALAASGLAGVYDAPVILVWGDRLGEEAEEQLKRLEPGRAFIIGSEGVVSAAVADAVEELTGVEPIRLAGQNRFETSLAVYDYVENVDDSVSWSGVGIVATGFGYADALAVGPLAYATGSPILLADTPRGLGAELEALLLSDEGADAFDAFLLIGSEAVVSAGAESQLGSLYGDANVVRLAGGDRYLTAAAVADFAVWCGELSYDGMGVATGMNFPDALAGAALCGAKGSVLMLANPYLANGDLGVLGNVVSSNAYCIGGGYLFGSEAVVSDSVKQSLEAAIAGA